MLAPHTALGAKTERGSFGRKQLCGVGLYLFQLLRHNSPMKNRVVHFEIGAEDPEKLSEFYKKALGWEVNQWADSGYWMVGREADRAVGAIFGGIMKRFEQEKTINTIETENLDETMKAVTDNGGKIIKPKASMPMGDETMWWCYMADPQGNVFGLMQMVKNSK